MLKIEDLSVCYPGNQLASLTDFHLTMKPGEIVGIVGESGSGKSTVLKAILGALPKQTKILGEIKLEGDSLLQQTSEQWQKIRGTQLSLIFQDSSSALNPIRKIGTQYEEYILQHECLSKEEAQGKAKDMLLKMRLPDPESIMDSYPHQLSGGMCQRVGIAMAMTFTPQLLLADEPTSALDVVTQQQIVEELLKGNTDEADPEVLTRSEAADYLGVTVDALRNWELNGLLTVKRSANRYRIYMQEDLQRLKIIRTLRGANYSLEAILRLLLTLDQRRVSSIKEVLDTPHPDEDIITVCDQLLTSLEQAKKNAVKIGQEIDRLEKLANR